MKNAVEVNGDVAYILIKRMNGDVLRATIDTSELPVVSVVDGFWRVTRCASTGDLYVECRPKCGRRQRLHRLITGAPDGMVVDHINHNTLDNRRANLRVVTIAENTQNRRGARRSNSSGLRGVSWHARTNKWRARAVANGRDTHLGYFSNIEDAVAAVVAFRREHMPYSALDQAGREERPCDFLKA